jgi:hypothetical protein
MIILMVINTAESMTQEKGSNVGKFLMPTLHYLSLTLTVSAPIQRYSTNF